MRGTPRHARVLRPQRPPLAFATPQTDAPLTRRAVARRRRGLRAATVWSYAQNLGRLGITSGLTLLLAVYLGPRAFGVMALALAFTGFAEMLQKQGLAPAIISRRDLTNEVADTAFWLVCAASVTVTVLAYLLAPFYAGLNDLPELTQVVRVLALGVPITALVVVQEAILRRQMRFRALALRTWISAGAGGIAGVTGAVLGWGVWALVAQQMVMNVVAVVVLWAVSTWRPRFDFEPRAARMLWSYSLRSVGGSIGLFIGGRIDLLLAGPLFGALVVGLYRLANRLTALVVDVSARSMQAVSLPALAALQHDRAALGERLVRMQRTVTLVCVPALGVVAGAAQAIESVLGPDWAGTGQAIVLMVPGQAAVTMTLLFGPALQAIGRPGLMSLLTWGWVATNAVALPLSAVTIGRENPLAAMCIATTTSALITLGTHAVVVSRTVGFSLADTARAWLPGIAGGLLGGLVAWGVCSLLLGASAWLALGGSGLVGVLTAGAVVLATAPELRRTVIGRR